MSRVLLSPGRRIHLLLLLVLLAAGLPFAAPAQAAGPFVVNTTADDIDISINSACATAAGQCSLRAAMQEAIAAGTATQIKFAIPATDPGYNTAGGYATIQVTSRLPFMTSGNIEIDGTSQSPGRSAGPKIIIDGSNLTAGNGFEISSSGNIIRGMGIIGFKSLFIELRGNGVYIDGPTAYTAGRTANNNTITQSWIGLSAAGTGSPNESYGVYVRNASNTQITNNVISSNLKAAVYINSISAHTEATGNTIADNIIGTTSDGSAAISGGNPADGIFLYNRSTNTSILRNLISGFGVTDASAVRVEGVGINGVTISDNKIGTNASGLTAIRNLFGITIRNDVKDVTISNNIISGNSAHGINVQADVDSVGLVTIQNNRIGVTANNTALGNGSSGIALYRDNNNAIGVIGSTIQGNTISANGRYGIEIGFSSASAADFANHVIAGNFIGTPPGGGVSNPSFVNQQSGIQISSGANIRIGGPAVADRNIIAARSNQAGLRLTGGNVTGTTIQNNYIGLAADGATALMSAADRTFIGILVETGANNTTIAQNIVSANEYGIEILNSSNVSLRGNAIGTTAGGSLNGNRLFGLWMVNASSVTIGGVNTGDTNIIAGNGTGVHVEGTSTSNIFEKNSIHDNSSHGMYFKGAGASGNTVRANSIVHNGTTASFDGIYVDGAQRILITQTTSSNNTGNGIGLASGSNANQAAPSLNTSLSAGTNGEALVTGTAPICAGGSCTIELFSSTAREDGEGPRYLNVITVASGAAFSIDAKDCDRFLTATARDVNGNTSPFLSPMIDTGTGCTSAKPTLSPGTPVSNAATPNIVNAPGTVTYQHTLTNSGGLPGTFTIELGSSNGWVTTTDFPVGGVVLNKDEARIFNVTVTVPANARGGPPSEITTVTAKVGALTDVQRNYTQLKQSFGVTIDTLTKQFTTTPTDLDFLHTLINTGNGIDTLSISAVNINIAGSPTFSYPNGQQCVNVNPGASCTLIVRVGIPSGNTGGTFSVTATAGGGATATATDTAFTNASIPELLPVTIQKEAYPSDMVTFVHTLKNVGTQSGSFTITPPANVDEWTFNVTPVGPITLASGASQDITLTAQLPDISSPNASAGLIKSFILKVESEDGGIATATDSVKVLLKPQFEFSAAAVSPVSKNPLEMVSFVHTLKNTSNGDDSYTIQVSPSSGLELVTVIPSSPISVARGASVQVTIQARIKAGTLESVDLEQLSVIAQSVSTPQPVAQNQIDMVTVLGSAVPALRVSPSSSGPVQPGSTVRLTYTLRNDGNKTGSFGALAVNLPGVPAGWTSTFVDPADCGALAAGASCAINVDILLPAKAYAGDNGVSASVGSASVTAVIKVAAVPGVLLDAGQQGSVEPSATISYTHTLTNTGNVTDTFTLTNQATAGWLGVVTPASLSNVPPGESRQISLAVTAPAFILAGSIGDVTLSAKSGLDANVSASVTDKTSILAVTRASLIPDAQTTNALAGQVVSFTPTLRNTGSTAVAYDLSVETAGWTSIVTPTTTAILQPGQELALNLTVKVPVDTPIGDLNLTTLRVQERGTTLLLTTGSYTTTTAITGRMLDPLVNEATVLPGTTYIYTHTLRNTGSLADTFLLSTIATNGWRVTASPSTVFLQAGETQQIEVSVLVPAGLAAGQLDYSYLKVQALNSPQLNATATEITTIKQFANMLLSPNQTVIVQPGQQLDLQHTLLSLGNALDSYTITAESEQGWPISIIVPLNGTVSLQPKASFPVMIRIQVPANITFGAVDRVSIVATSHFDPQVKSSVVAVLRYPLSPEEPPETRHYLWLPLIDAP